MATTYPLRNNEVAAATTFVIRQPCMHYNVSHKSDDFNASRDCDDYNASRDCVDFNASSATSTRFIISYRTVAITTTRCAIATLLTRFIISHGGDYDNASRNCNDFNMTYHIIASHGGDNDNSSTASHIILPRPMAVTMMMMRYKGSNTTTAVDEEATCYYTSSIDATINY
jgi:hypothetical protein